ncbi:hypothetical protein GMSM_18100 [Geomonas sp. Red276]
MQVRTRYLVINLIVMAIALTAATAVFLAQLRTQAIIDAKHEQEERLQAFKVLLHEKGDAFEIRDGKLWVGSYLLTGNNDLPDHIRDIFGGTATIFQGDLRVATNVITSDGTRAIGTRLVGPAHDAIFKYGREYRGEVTILGVPYFAAYDPIRDSHGEVIGAIYVGVKKGEFFALYDTLKGRIVIGCLILNVFLVLFSLLAVQFGRQATRALERRDQKMRAMLNIIPDLAWIKDEQGCFVAVNAAFARACSQTPESVIGKSDLDIWPREFAEAYRADDREVMQSGTSRQFEEQIVGSDGSTRWIETIKTPIFNSKGEVVGTTGMARDITARRFADEELRFTRNCVEHSRDGISWIEEDGRFIFANESLSGIFGRSPEEMKSLYVYDLVEEYDAGKWAKRWATLMEKGSLTNELTAISPDGRRIPIEVSSNYLLYNDKGLVCSFVRDISERRRFEEKDRETLSLLTATLESIVDGILVLDLEKRTVMHNRKYPQLVGIPDSIMATRDYRAMLEVVLAQLKDPDDFRRRLAEMMGQPEREWSIMMEFTDGRIIERVSCPYLRDDRLVGTVVNFRDVTMQRKVETHLRNAQKVEALGTLTGGIAHDFNNRLTAIIGYGTLIGSDEGLSEQSREYLDLLLTSADRSAELTKGLLAYSRKQDLNPVLLDLNAVVTQAEKFFPSLIGENVQLSIELSKQTPMIRADRGQLEQVLFNLVGNARDAMDGVGRLTIATGSASVDRRFIDEQGYGAEGDYAILTVTDTGAGIDAATLERIFEPFFTTKEVGKGTGLGLSIAYGIVKQHEGFINVVSQPGVGTTFWVYLPLVAGIAQDRSGGEGEVRHGKGETVLVVEDDAEVRLMFREVLLRHGYRVIEAVDGADGVVKFHERGALVDVVMIDVIMPRKNGWEAYNEIKKLRGDVRAIFISGYTDDIVTKAGLADKGLHFLQKPVSPGKLLEKLREVLDQP